MILCSQCGFQVSRVGLTHIQPVECPSCGKFPLLTDTPEGAFTLVRNYFSDLWQILRHPRLFFRKMPVQGGMARPLCFALVTHWLGASLGYLGQISFGISTHRFFENLFQPRESSRFGDPGIDQLSLNQAREKILEWIFGTGPIIADPFLTLCSILFTAALVFIGARILVSLNKTHPTYESAVRILCFGLTPSILKGIPFVGPFAAPLWVLGVTIIGVKEVYQVQTARAFVIALFPKILFLGTILMGVMVFLMLFFKLFISFFM